MLTVTPTAAEAISALLAWSEAPEGSGLRIAANESAAESAGALELSLVPGPDDLDEVVEERGAHVFLAPEAAEFLSDKQLDAQVEGERVGFFLFDQTSPDGSSPSGAI